jgi:hypothetical protein
MALQFVLELEGIPNLAVQLNRVVTSDGQCLAVCREGMVSDRIVEEMVDLGSSHVGNA